MDRDAGSGAPDFHRFALSAAMRLSVLPTKKLKTILAKVYLPAALDESSVTQRSLLPLALRRGTKSLPTMQAISRHLEQLYGTEFWSNVIKVGEMHVSVFQIDVVNDRFLPEKAGLFAPAIRFLSDLVFAPHLESGSFAADSVAQEKETLARTIEGLIDDKSTYASFRCAEEMCAGEPYRLNEQGRIDDLAAIDSDGLTASWERWVREWPIEIYVAGDVDPSEVRDHVAAVFTARDRRPRAVDWVPAAAAAPPECRLVDEELDVQQGKLVIGYRGGARYTDPEHEAYLVMNCILGGMSTSKLFQNVREKASLAYSASSWTERSKGVLFVNAGIAPENKQRAIDICLRQVELVGAGEIMDDELIAAKRSLINANVMLEDNLSALAAADCVRSLHGQALDLEGFRSGVERVTRDDVARVASRLALDTIYYLGPKEPRDGAA